MGLFAIIANGSKSPTNVSKDPMLDDAGVLDEPPSKSFHIIFVDIFVEKINRIRILLT